ncbi:hypothetical protein FOZ61_010221 [Perkinsus olseni]|uniref:Uncharacterized protein n=1 Tax=Perkinsus olseni TaxID=32597 RepID=A0A7J6KXY2_PEROL|nr:hypothetical protein FOL46_000516 [Perkinsus olseni]KAF4651777.1 hypothetical protein FOZ61_010221 [Perkinsus olseni]
MPGHLMAPLYSKWSSLEMFLDQPWFAYIPTSWSRVKGVNIDKHTETYSVAAVTMSAIGFGTRLAHAGVINSTTALTIIGKVVDCSFGLNGTLKSRHELDKMITMSLGLVQAREVANADLSTTNPVDSVLNSALNHFEGFSLPPPKLDRTATSWKKQGWKDQDRWTSKQKSGSNWQGNWQGNGWWCDEGSKSKARQAETSDKHSKPSS